MGASRVVQQLPEIPAIDIQTPRLLESPHGVQGQTEIHAHATVHGTQEKTK